MALRHKWAPLAFAFVLAAAAGTLRAQQAQIPGAIRTGITMVPVDVRVLDRNGQPVTDLTQSDFTIFENGVPQEIRHFSTSALAPAAPAASGPAYRSADTAPASATAPRTNRVFLFVLARGRLQVPAKGLDGLISLVRNHLLPQDQAAVLAFNRATDFTDDHERIVRVLERYREANAALETRLGAHFSGLQAVYGSRQIPARIQTAIDDVFDEPEAPPFRRLPTARIADQQQLEDDYRREDGFAPVTDLGELWFGYDRSGYRRARTQQDLESLYTGIEYLRHLEGEKHLVFVTEYGLRLPRARNDRTLAALASDARVAISTIHTGGVAIPPTPFELSPFRPFGPSAPVFPSRTWGEYDSVMTLANIARLTGGIASAYVYANEAAARIDTATRFQYLLAYEPSNPAQDGRFRRITVKVNRPDVTVLYRHGYYAHEQLVPYDRRQFMTYSRIATAGYDTAPIRDIELGVKAAPRGGSSLDVELRIDISRLHFESAGGRRVATLEVALFAGDRRQKLVGERWETIDLRLTEDAYARAARNGYRHTAAVPISGRPMYIKAIVYDPNADVLGTAVQRMR